MSVKSSSKVVVSGLTSVPLVMYGEDDSRTVLVSITVRPLRESGISRKRFFPSLYSLISSPVHSRFFLERNFSRGVFFGFGAGASTASFLCLRKGFHFGLASIWLQTVIAARQIMISFPGFITRIRFS